VIRAAGVPVTEATNPMWDRTTQLIRAGKLELHPGSGIIRQISGFTADWRASVAAHSPYVSHPETLATVIKWCGPKVVTALVGNCYWPWLLAEARTKVTAYDHRQLWGPKTWLEPVHKLTNHYSVIRRYDDSTLLLVQPDKLDRAARVMREHNGPSVVYVGRYPPVSSPMLTEVMGLWDVEEVFRPPVYWAYAPFEVVRFVRPKPRVSSPAAEEGRVWNEQPTQLLRPVPLLLPRRS
jgi:hypothetical protein